jgi:uncharacterized protein
LSAWYRWEGDSLILHLRVQPKARADEFAGVFGESQYRIRITAPPVDGKANRHLAAFLAKQFGVSKRAVVLVSGEGSRDKVVRITSPSRLPLPEITR